MKALDSEWIRGLATRVLNGAIAGSQGQGRVWQKADNCMHELTKGGHKVQKWFTIQAMSLKHCLLVHRFLGLSRVWLTSRAVFRL